MIAAIAVAATGADCPPPPPPTGALSIVSITPADGSTAVSLTPTIQVVFSHSVDTGTLSGDLQPSTTDFTLEWSSNNTVLTVALVGPLAADTTYFVAIDLAFDTSGNQLTNPSSSCFSTGATLDCPTFECLAFDATDGSVPAYADYSYQPPFASDSPWNTPIGDNPGVASDTATMIARFAQTHDQFGGLWVGVIRNVVPVYFADASTTTFDVPLSEPNEGIASVLTGVPIPSHALADCGYDRFLTIWDTSANRIHEFYRAEQGSDGSWTAGTGNSMDTVTGSGIYTGNGSRSSQGIRASGSSMLAGLIWPNELAAGQINHALAAGYEFIRSGGPVAPFTASDGLNDDAAAIPMGSRLQLDPSLDLSTLGLQAWELTIAEALQTYGMFIVDTAGGIPLSAVHVHSFEGNPYSGLLPDTIAQEEGVLLSGLPASSFRVLSPSE